MRAIVSVLLRRGLEKCYMNVLISTYEYSTSDSHLEDFIASPCKSIERTLKKTKV